MAATMARIWLPDGDWGFLLLDSGSGAGMTFPSFAVHPCNWEVAYYWARAPSFSSTWATSARPTSSSSFLVWREVFTSQPWVW